MPLREGQDEPLPLDHHVVIQLAKATVPSVLEAIVELVTNSDDSYSRLEGQGLPVDGRIFILLLGKKGGGWRLVVIDRAEGMDAETLDRATTFAAPASGFYEGKSVRGLFGRGLKESIVALGAGRIITVRDCKESIVEIITDDSGKARRKAVKVDSRVEAPNGTIVLIEGLDQPFPRQEIIERQLQSHFALRHILRRRRVLFFHASIAGREDAASRFFENMTSDILSIVDGLETSAVALQPDELAGNLVSDQEFPVPDLGQVRLQIFEVDQKLEYEGGQPWSQAGFIITSQGTPLDLDLFGHDNDEAGHYFYGYLECPRIAELLRAGDFKLINPNRSGLNWRDRRCRALRQAAAQVLRPLIQEKRRQLVERTPQALSSRQVRRLVQLLNTLAAAEMEESEFINIARGASPLRGLFIRPERAYSAPGEQRSFSVYLVPDASGSVISAEVALELLEATGEIVLSDNVITVAEHKGRSFLKGSFVVAGKNLGDRALIRAYLLDDPELEDLAEFVVREPGHSKRRRLSSANRGVFRQIEFDATPDPIQRVYCNEEGVIKIYVEFPPLRQYFRVGQEANDALSDAGAVMFAELIAEAFCNRVARYRLVREPLPIGDPQAAVDRFNNYVNSLRKRCADEVHRVCVRQRTTGGRG
jgi:hypothetical protein